MLYKRQEFTKELFQNPTNEYRGAPFWSWNCKLTKEEADAILGDLKIMGMGGSHLHCRTGMDIPYLSEEFMELVRYSHEKANQLGMLTWLYDEDRFPSGAAGGKVTKNWDYRQRYLLFSPTALEENSQLKFLARYAVLLEKGFLKGYRRLAKEEAVPENFKEWYLYREIAGDNPWFNNQAYVDTLNPKAIACFIKETHEKYFEALGEAFGDTVPAIFTDEPQFAQKSVLGFAEERKRVILPYTEDFPESYEKAYHSDFFATFPECIWELPDGRVSVARYRFHDHICERFTEAFAKQIGNWCDKHKIALTGHMMQEPTLESQTGSLGEAMRAYEAFDIPGIDMLYDSRELNTAKQAQSAVHQYGREGMLSELYGVTGWEFDFRGHKLAGDWQAALGVTVRVHHLTWTSMAGEAKRDYPASIGYQSPWYKEYPLIENYFSRLNTVLSRGKALVKVGVIHPIESYWLYWGNKEQTQGLRDEMDERFKKLTEWLLFGLIDFDFISESLWKNQTPDDVLLSDEAFSVGKMKYETILVPNCVTLRRSTLERLKAFQKKGGRVIFLGELPRFIDAIPSDEAEIFSENCEKIHFAKENVLNVLQKERLLDVHDQSGMRTANLIYQLREEEDRKWLFLAHCNAMPNPDLPQREDLVIEIDGIYDPIRYDAMTGEICEALYFHKDGKTVIRQTAYDHDSLLYSLQPAAEEKEEEKSEAEEKEYEELELESYLDAELAEPNVLVLDFAEVKVEEEPWQKEEEILRLDNKLRERFGYPKREEAFPQPWVMEEKEKETHLIQLRFKIFSDIEVEKTFLALEEVENTRLFLNGEEIPAEAEGYYVDRSIAKVPLPGLHRGENILTAQVKYNSRVNLEAIYLLGDFGVKLAGRNTRLVKAEEKMAFGDIRSQGLPFYGGNLTYKTSIDLDEKSDLRIEITRFRSPLLKVFLDGKDCGAIAFSPYVLEISDVMPGKHQLEIEFFGNRYNTFGALHNCNDTLSWKGHPNSYRTVGEAWSYEYQLHPQGILKAPVIKLRK